MMSITYASRVRTIGEMPVGAAAVVLAGLFAAVAGGCYDVGTDLDRLPQRPVRPAAVPLTPTSPPARGAVAEPAPAAQPGKPAQRAQEETAVKPAATVGREKDRSYQQVVLVTGEMLTENQPGLRYVVLERGPAQEVGNVLSWLYPPAGPAGSKNRYSLLYPSLLEADAAAQAVADLDVLPAQEDRTEPATPVGNKAFALGLGLLYRGATGDVLNKERMRRAEGILARAAADAKLPPARRWAAARIAARISADQLGDLEAAKRHLAVAETLSEAGSLEKMVTWLAQADACVQNGEPKSAQRLLGKILTGFPALQDTEAFERAKQAKAELDRNR